MDSKHERIWIAAESVRNRVASFLVEKKLGDTRAYISESRDSHPDPTVFTFGAIAGAAHASIEIRASQIEHNKDDVSLFALLVARCLYQRLTSR
jgi:hypothetical protein